MSPYEHAAREKKATAIAMYLIPQLFRNGRTDNLRRLLEAAPESVRETLAASAGQKRPSARTWQRVIELVEHEKQYRETPARVEALFAGLA